MLVINFEIINKNNGISYNVIPVGIYLILVTIPLYSFISIWQQIYKITKKKKIYHLNLDKLKAY